MMCAALYSSRCEYKTCEKLEPLFSNDVEIRIFRDVYVPFGNAISPVTLPSPTIPRPNVRSFPIKTLESSSSSQTDCVIISEMI